MTYDLVSNGETITLGCSVRNQPKNGRFGGMITRLQNQIDDLKDRQSDLNKNKYHEQRNQRTTAKRKERLVI